MGYMDAVRVLAFFVIILITVALLWAGIKLWQVPSPVVNEPQAPTADQFEKRAVIPCPTGIYLESGDCKG